ncbi:uncharacterized protein LOC143305705 [Osmia lignaria lignaria]|uniref:uncharacterized protein LOC143305705 n=1 Tax=Osmia lignaria lignaria TaxID=1437193 RepID=UPI00402BCE15
MSRDYSANRPIEGSPNASFRQLDKQSYFFQSYKTETDIDREMMMFDRSVLDEKKIDYADEEVAAASGGSLNCFGGLEKEKGCNDHDEKKQKSSMAVGRHHATTHDTRRDSGNVEFLEKEGEIFKISSSELLQESSGKKKRNFSFNNKEKNHRSLESLERSIDLSVMDCKSLDLLSEEQPKTFYHGNQRSLDSSQKSKKSMDSSVNKTRKRPNFFQRVRRSWHFLLMQRRIRQRNKYERPPSGREKCEYFLQRLHKNDFIERLSSLPINPPRVQTSVDFFPERDTSKDQVILTDVNDDKEFTVQLENSTFRVNDEEKDLPDENTNMLTRENEAEGCSLTGENDVSLKTQEIVDNEKKEQFMEWVVTIANLDALSHGTHSNDSIGCGILHGTLGILKSILFDIFLCICI